MPGAHSLSPRRRQFNKKLLMEIFLERPVNSLFPQGSGQNHFLLPSLCTLFRSNHHSLPTRSPSEELCQLVPAPHYTSQHLQSAISSRRGRSQGGPVWFQAFFANGELMAEPSRCIFLQGLTFKVVFHISTGGFNGKLHNIPHI